MVSRDLLGRKDAPERVLPLKDLLVGGVLGTGVPVRRGPSAGPRALTQVGSLRGNVGLVSGFAL